MSQSAVWNVSVHVGNINGSFVNNRAVSRRNMDMPSAKTSRVRITGRSTVIRKSEGGAFIGNNCIISLRGAIWNIRFFGIPSRHLLITRQPKRRRRLSVGGNAVFVNSSLTIPPKVKTKTVNRHQRNTAGRTDCGHGVRRLTGGDLGRRVGVIIAGINAGIDSQMHDRVGVQIEIINVFDQAVKTDNAGSVTVNVHVVIVAVDMIVKDHGAVAVGTKSQSGVFDIEGIIFGLSVIKRFIAADQRGITVVDSSVMSASE